MQGFSRLSRKFSVSPLYVNPDNSSSSTNLSVIIFGANSQLTPTIVSNIVPLGARFTYPVRTSAKWVDTLKPMTNFRETYIAQYLDFRDPQVIPRLIKGNNVVINLIGGVSWIKDYDNLYESNVTMAKQIAEACAASPDVKRLIHFSAVGADPQSPSTRLQTKWLGEQEVKNAYPRATIFRPCTIYGTLDNFLNRIATMRQMFNFVPVIDSASQLMQPIFDADLGKCVLNALRLEESIGQTYELGGPHVYSYLEVIEMVFNKIGRLPEVKSIPFDMAHRFLRWLPHHHGTNRWMSLNDVHESKVDLVVRPEAKSIADLYVNPVSMSQVVKAILVDHVAKYNLTLDESEHGWHLGQDRDYEP